MNYNYDDENGWHEGFGEPERPEEPVSAAEETPEAQLPPAEEPEKPLPEWREAAYREFTAPTETPYSPGFTGGYYYSPPRPEPEEEDDEFDYRKARRRGRGGRFARAVCLVLVCALVGAGAGWGAVQYGIKTGTVQQAATTVVLGATTTPVPSLDGLLSEGGATGVPVPTPVTISGDTLSAQEIYKIASTQVVCVSTEIPQKGFGQGGTIYGSGFIISEDGYIMTNYHVIEDASLYGYPLTVVMRDGTSYKAKVMGYEADNDIAVIKIDAKSLAPVKIGSSDAMQVGEKIYAVGNPRKLDYTMTDGIVSALDRDIQVDEYVSIKMFQISAAVNSGNSGGPVYNDRGEVLGIVSAKYASSGTEGLGFAIPIDDAMSIASEIITNGYVTGKAKLGITVRTVDASTAEYYNMVEGAFVNTVEPGSCAEKA
ncbi:MAG: S1C family serine protease, partial [Oscillospiraceae bacterium]|nr:S1C family serine protease [Oscillospiraceae bacterium]